MNQKWASYFGSLVHGSELTKMSVYIAPLAEVGQICGAQADGCYSDGSRQMVLSSQAVGGISTEQVAAHEYGHHIANFRSNPPWKATEYGPKYWASAANICARVRQGSALINDNGEGYDRNPAEAWAETYRVLATGDASWPILDRSFYPSQAALDATRRDVVQPWTSAATRNWAGAFTRATRGREPTMALDTPLDGRLVIRSTGTRRLDTDIYLYAPGGSRPIAKATHDGSKETLAANVCGRRKVDVGIYRYKRYGSFSVRASIP